MGDKYSQFKEFILFFEEFYFISSLYEFLNESNEVRGSLFNGQIEFKMRYSDFKNKFLRKLRYYAKNSCGVVCQSDNMCDGHRTLEYLEQYDAMMTTTVVNEKVFYKNISIFKDGKNTDPVMGYVFVPMDRISLEGKTWSQRVAFLN